MKLVYIFFGLLILTACNKTGITEPKKLIDKDVMTNILYDLALLEAVRTQISESDQKFTGKADEYIYKKYKIDSLQFAKSNQYYAADVEEYKEMFEEIKGRITAENDKLNAPKITNGKEVAK